MINSIKKWGVISLLLCPLFSFAAPPHSTESSTRNQIKSGLAEGLVLANFAKNTVIGNAYDGFQFDKGWNFSEYNHLRTANIQSVEIDGKTGVVLVTGGIKIQGAKLILTPYIGFPDERVPLQLGSIPENRVTWHCVTLPAVPSTSSATNSIPDCKEIEDHIRSVENNTRNQTINGLKEGLVIAASAKNIVIDNAVMGFHLDRGWESFKPTVNIQSIEIDRKSGVILIIGSDKIQEARLRLTPYAVSSQGETAIQSGTIPPTGRIVWRCSYYSGIPVDSIPEECRTLHPEPLFDPQLGS